MSDKDEDAYKKTAGKLATFALGGALVLGAFFAGGKLEQIRTPPPSLADPIEITVRFPQTVEDSLRNILKKVADKKVSAEDAVAQICGKLGLSDIDLVDQVRQIVHKVAGILSEKEMRELIRELLKLANSKPGPSPIPTATIVVPRK